MREENGRSSPNRRQNRAVVEEEEEEEEEEDDTTNTNEEDVFFRLHGDEDDFLLSLISPSLSGGDGDGCSMDKLITGKHAKKKFGHQCLPSLASGSRLRFIVTSVAEELNENANILYPGTA